MLMVLMVLVVIVVVIELHYSRAALLASYGFVTLALAFYGVDDLPVLDKFDMNCFELAVEFLLSQPEVLDDKVGLLGVSTGGALALTMMTCMKDKIGACLVSAAVFGSFVLDTHYNGQGGAGHDRSKISASSHN